MFHKNVKQDSLFYIDIIPNPMIYSNNTIRKNAQSFGSYDRNGKVTIKI